MYYKTINGAEKKYFLIGQLPCDLGEFDGTFGQTRGDHIYPNCRSP